MKKALKTAFAQRSALIIIFISFPVLLFAQSAMTNIDGRNTTNLNGTWKVIVDPSGTGNWRQVWLEKKPEKKTDFYEYSFENGPTLEVPGDFNTQIKELTYMEGTVWYKKEFTQIVLPGKRYFIHFGAVNYVADVYFNGKHLGSHEGGFTPFQFEVTDHIQKGENKIVVKANSQRLKDGLPGLGYDWYNYGGITRDVNLVETPTTYIEDYHIQLKKHSEKEVLGWVQLNGQSASQSVRILIPELDIDYKTVTNNEGLAKVNFTSKFDLWSPDNPKLYNVLIQGETDLVIDEIGFRNIEVKGTKIYLNSESIFIKSVNIHEEGPLKGAKQNTEEGAALLLNWARDLGCNSVRLAHYPHNEYMIRLADKMGIMVWNEIPVYQHIEFSAPTVPAKMDLMMKEMIRRDRNRSSVIIWSLSNETYNTTPGRDKALVDIIKACKEIDSTRLLTHVINNQGYDNNTFNVWDPLYDYVDIISLNEYLGWYVPWQGKPEDTKWVFNRTDKPVFISEFGGESLYGSDYGPKDEAAYWSEEYQEQIYKDQITMFQNVPNLVGVCPWILADYRSLGRMHPIYQNGYNRKGLLSDKGEKKKAWYVVKEYYDKVKN